MVVPPPLNFSNKTFFANYFIKNKKTKEHFYFRSLNHKYSNMIYLKEATRNFWFTQGSSTLSKFSPFKITLLIDSNIKSPTNEKSKLFRPLLCMRLIALKLLSTNHSLWFRGLHGIFWRKNYKKHVIKIN